MLFIKIYLTNNLKSERGYIMKLPSIQNFHKHTDDTNPIIKDSPITYEMLAKKTIENGGKILSSVSHGWQGRYHICYEVAK